MYKYYSVGGIGDMGCSEKTMSLMDVRRYIKKDRLSPATKESFM